jgi:pyrroloquinoline quinone biosynthesis protein B
VAGFELDILSQKHKSYPTSDSDGSRKEKGALVQVIGSAQDGGIPHIGCFCPNCQRAWKIPRFSRFISSLALFDFKENKTFLIDATPDIRAQTKMIQGRMEPKKGGDRYWPDGILLTHAHIGHYTGLMFYGYEALSTDRIPVFCSHRMNDFLSSNGPWSQLVSQKNIVLNPIDPERAFSLTSQISIFPFKVPHRDEYTDTFGYRITGPDKSLLYIPDIHHWKTWDRSVVEEVQKVDIALLDGTFFSPEELPSRDLSSIGHPFISDSIKILKEIAQKGKVQLLFTHMNHSNLALDPEGKARKTIESNAFALAEDGMEFYL